MLVIRFKNHNQSKEVRKLANLRKNLCALCAQNPIYLFLMRYFYTVNLKTLFMGKLKVNLMWYVLLTLALLPILQAQETAYRSVQYFQDSLFMKVHYPFVFGTPDSLGNGRFLAEMAFPEADSGAVSYRALFVKSNLKDGKFDGPVLLSKSHLTVGQTRQLWSQYALVQPLMGHATEVSGEVVHGTRTGLWEVKKVEVTRGEVGAVQQQLAVNYDKSGQINGPFQWVDSGQVIASGQFGAEGKPEGIWHFHGQNNAPTLTLRFRSGRLIEGQLNGVKVFVSLSNPGIRMAISDTLAWWIAHLFSSEGLEISNHSQWQLAEFWEAVSNLAMEGELSEKLLPRGLFSSGKLFLELPLYPFFQGEALMYEQVFEGAFELMASIDSTINHPPFHLGHYQDARLASTMASLDMLKVELNVMGHLTEIMRHPYAQFLDRERLGKRHLSKIQPIQIKSFEFKNQALVSTIQLPIFGKDELVSAYLMRLHDSIQSLLDFQLLFVKDVLKELEVAKEVAAVEGNLIDKASSLKAALESDESVFMTTTQRNLYRGALASALRKAMEGYTQAPRHEKLAAGEQALACLAQIEMALADIPRIQALEKKIHNAFHEVELNPVTLTKMETTKHERIFLAYREKVMPFLLKELDEACQQGCEAIILEQQRIMAFLNHMVKLGNENPRKINRRIRSGDSPTLLLEKMGFF
jgi:hypothetical protein